MYPSVCESDLKARSLADRGSKDEKGEGRLEKSHRPNEAPFQTPHLKHTKKLRLSQVASPSLFSTLQLVIHIIMDGRKNTMRPPKVIPVRILDFLMTLTLL